MSVNTSQPTFVHLRCHSEYSIVDGTVRIDDYVEYAVKDKMPALALTDLSNLFGAIKFYKEARGKGVKPLLGCDLWLENALNRDQPYRLMLLCQTLDGYTKLCALISRAYLENQYRGRPEIKREWVVEAGSEGLIMLSSAMMGDVGQALLQGNTTSAKQLAQAWADLFPNRFYIELQRAGHTQQEAYISRAVALASQLVLPVVATHPVQFIETEDFKAHEARVCIAEGYVLADTRRPKAFTEDQYFKTQAEMAALFADIPEALANSVEIAKRCNLTLSLGKNFLPQFPTPNGEGLDEYLVIQAKEGLVKRLAVLYPDPEKRAAKAPEYEARLAFETSIIIQMGFPGYF
ncbi:MAG: PHP domain-containing protein, partial [Methylophilaceae bacterium]|nr:PHP domain-containing protein [Methylophilaceae bacterium]